MKVAFHIKHGCIFTSLYTGWQVRIWDTEQFDVLCTASVGFPITGVAFSNEEYGCSTYDKTGWV